MESKPLQTQTAGSEDAEDLTEGQWHIQRLVAEKLRSLRESAGMARAELAQKMGCPETLVEQYEDGTTVRMEIWPVFDMVRLLHANLNDLVPDRLIIQQFAANGYADLDDDSRHVADRVIAALLKEQIPSKTLARA